VIERLHGIQASAASAQAARQRLASRPEWIDEALRELGSGVDECLVLATCERFELFVSAAPEARLPSELCGVALECAAVRHGPACAARLLRIAAGLESRLRGEPHVLGQVTRAVQRARSAGVLGSKENGMLATLAVRAIRAGRRVRAETPLGALARSYVSATIDAVGAARASRATWAGARSSAAARSPPTSTLGCSARAKSRWTC
jgi:glutamyl-tRNA reductase